MLFFWLFWWLRAGTSQAFGQFLLGNYLKFSRIPSHTVSVRYPSFLCAECKVEIDEHLEVSAGVTPADFYALDIIPMFPMFFGFEEYKRVGCGLMRTGLRELTGTVEEDYSCVCSRGFEEIVPYTVIFFFDKRRKGCFVVAGDLLFGGSWIWEVYGRPFWGFLRLLMLTREFEEVSGIDCMSLNWPNLLRLP